MKLISHLVVAALLASPSLLYAQAETEAMTVRIPFPFKAQGISLPAGKYDVSYTMRNHLWSFRTFGHYAVEVRVAGEDLPQPAPVSSLSFDHDANGYILRQIRQVGHADAAQVLPPRAASKSTLHEAKLEPDPDRAVTPTRVTVPSARASY